MIRLASSCLGVALCGTWRVMVGGYLFVWEALFVSQGIDYVVYSFDYICGAITILISFVTMMLNACNKHCDMF